MVLSGRFKYSFPFVHFMIHAFALQIAFLGRNMNASPMRSIKLHVKCKVTVQATVHAFQPTNAIVPLLKLRN